MKKNIYTFLRDPRKSLLIYLGGKLAQKLKKSMFSLNLRGGILALLHIRHIP